jgi:spore coat protein U-like protein
MSGGGVNLPYQLYTSATRTVIWGDGTGGSSAVNGADSLPRDGGTTVFTVYGQIAARQIVTPGAYIDSILATVNY